MKRSMAFVVLFAIVIACFAPMSALAATEPEVFNTSYVYKNPLYENFVFQKTLLSTESYGDSVVYYDAISDTAAVLRSGMEERDGVICAGYATTGEYTDDLHYKIFQEATEHTGVPTQGDYLLWHFGNYNVNISYYTQNGVTYISFTYNVQYLSDAQMEQRMDTAVDALLLELDVDKKTDYEKVCAVYNYICKNITYDYDGLAAGSKTAHTAYGALVNKTSVCQGYASLFYRLMLELDVDTRVISGIGGGGDHGWNIVALSDLYYNLDSTWDASYWEAGLDYHYFLKCDENFDDHLRSNEYATAAFYSEYPMADEDYVPEQTDKDLITDSAGNTYFSIEAALTSVKSGDTISLMSDVTSSDLVLPSGVSLDLNGCTLMVDSILSYSSNAIIDSSEAVSGLLKISDPDGNMISGDNAQLPVYDHTAGGYRFFTIDVIACAVTGKNTDTPKVWFKIQTENFAQLYDLICNDSKMMIEIKLTYDGQAEDTYAVASLAFTKTWADSYYANENVYVTVTLDSLDGLTNVSVTPCVGANGVEIQASESLSIPNKPAPLGYPYNVTYKEYLEMSEDEQVEFYKSFKNHNDFKEWRTAAKKVYDENQIEIEIGSDGTIDLDGLTGGKQ